MYTATFYRLNPQNKHNKHRSMNNNTHLCVVHFINEIYFVLLIIIVGIISEVRLLLIRYMNLTISFEVAKCM